MSVGAPRFELLDRHINGRGVVAKWPTTQLGELLSNREFYLPFSTHLFSHYLYLWNFYVINQFIACQQQIFNSEPTNVFS